MKTRALAFAAAVLLATFVACQKSETTETSTVSTEASTSTNTVTAATDTSMTTATTTTTETVPTETTTTSTTSTTTSGTEQIKHGAKELGQGLKEEARKAAVATGAAMQRGGAALEKKAEQAAPQPATAPPASTPAAAPATTSSGNAASGSAIFKSKCVACHGSDASSNTPMGKKNNIPDLRSAAVQGMSDAQIATIIANGKPGGLSATAHKSKALTQAQIQDVVAYLRSIRQ